MTYAGIEHQLALNMGVNPNICKFVRLNEKPSIWRHACSQFGVTVVKQPNKISIDDVRVEFIYCTACLKIIYFVEEQV